MSTQSLPSSGRVRATSGGQHRPAGGDVAAEDPAMRAPIFRRADIGGCRSVERVLEQESPASREYVVPDVPTGEEGRKTERTVSRPRNVRSAWFAGPTSSELAAFTTGCVRGFLTRPTTTVSHRRGSYMSFASRGGRAS